MKGGLEANNGRFLRPIVAHTELLVQARLLQEATTAFRSSLSVIHVTLKNSGYGRNFGLDITSAEIIGNELADHSHKLLDSTAVAMKQVEDVHNQARYKLQAMRSQRNMAETMIHTCISSIVEANIQDLEELGRINMFRLPPELWAQIFFDVTLPDRETPSPTTQMPQGWLHGSRAMLLASVCRSWREVAINTKSLWSTINVAPGKQSIDTLSEIVDLHLARMEPLPCSLLIEDVPKDIAQEIYREIEPIFSRVKKLHQLGFHFDEVASNLVTLLYNELPTPDNRFLKRNKTDGSCFVHFRTFKPAVKRLTLVSCGIFGFQKAFLTHITAHQLNQGYIKDWMGPAVETIEHAILPYQSTHVAADAGRLTAPLLRYLETTLSLLSNGILRSYHMPNLRELVVVDAACWVNKWEDIAKQLSKETNLEKLTVGSTERRGARTLISQLGALSSLTSLELRGESVEDGLGELAKILAADKCPLQTLGLVVLADYAGDGQAILDFADGIKAQKRIKLEVINCPNLSGKMKESVYRRLG